MDPITGAVVIAGLGTVGKPAAELVKDLVERFLGPAVDAKGQALKQWLEGRNERAANTLLEASELLQKAGIEPQPVPGRILFPLLQSAALEEDEDLHSRWAALLSNAASPTSANMILPAYVEILRQLTPIQAKLLNWIVRNSRVLDRNGQPVKFPVFLSVSRDRILRDFGIDVHQYNLLAADLHRLGLIHGGHLKLGSSAERRGVVMSTYMDIDLTTLGVAFVYAVNPPGADLGGIQLPPSPPEELAEMKAALRPQKKSKKK